MGFNKNNFNFLKILKKKLYIISFDQYEEEFDPFNKIQELFIDITSKNIISISLITLSSLYNNDIAQYIK